MYVCMYVCMYEMTVYPAESRLIPSRRVCRQSATFTTSLQQWTEATRKHGRDKEP